VNQYQKDKTILDFNILMKQEMMEWQWHQLDYMQIIRFSLQTSTPSLNFLTGQTFFLWPNQQCQSTESTKFGDKI